MLLTRRLFTAGAAAMAAGAAFLPRLAHGAFTRVPLTNPCREVALPMPLSIDRLFNVNGLDVALVAHHNSHDWQIVDVQGVIRTSRNNGHTIIEIHVTPHTDSVITELHVRRHNDLDDGSTPFRLFESRLWPFRVEKDVACVIGIEQVRPSEPMELMGIVRECDLDECGWANMQGVSSASPWPREYKHGGKTITGRYVPIGAPRGI